MSNILISLTKSESLAMGRMTINESCGLCKRTQKNDEVCIRHHESNKIICKSCVKAMLSINLHSIAKDPNQIDLCFK
jgi:hypothetical protein